MTSRLPERLGPYRIERALGEGGMGTVFVAVGPGGERAAVKLLRAEAASRTPSALPRFEQEAAIRIAHPNVVKVLGAGHDAQRGLPWIAFELLEGESLEERLERGPLPVAEAVEVALGVARGLVPAHEAGIVHRDIKPSNLFLCADGATKILDFGIARNLERDTRLTAEGGTVGTVAYFSPEQARGDAGIDGRTDQWSLGVVLYEMLVGRNPFDRGDVLPTMLAILAERPPPVTALAPHVPAVVADVVARCLGATPAERFADAEALVDALEGLRPIEPAARSDAPTTLADAVAPPSIPPGEARFVAVLLADEVGSHDGLAAAIEGHGGLFLPLPGAQAVGVFGAQTWEGDEIARAARAALEARDAARSVAVSAGRVTYSGSTGITGAALREAREGCDARLAGVAVSAEVARQLGDGARLRPVSETRFELTGGAGDRTTAVPDPAPRPMVGRDAELAQLERAVSAAFEEGRPSAMLVLGPAGAGKTRLRRELIRLLDPEADEPVTVLLARGEPLDAADRAALPSRFLTAYARARGWTGLDRSSPLEDRLAAVSGLVRDAFGDSPRAAEHAPFLGLLLGVPMPSEPGLDAARRDPRLMADRLRIALVEWVEAMAATRPVALVLEDLHWLDDATLEVIEDIVQGLDGEVLVFATARPELEERFEGFLTSAGAVRVELRGLLRADVGALAASIAGRPLDPALVARLTEHTGGNPLFVEQTVLVLAEEGRLDEPGGELPLPRTIEAAVQGRLDHLPSAEKETCKRAAILGRPFTREDLAILGVIHPAPVLASLVRRGLLIARGRGRGVREYGFRSQLVQEVAYRMVAEELRRQLHRQVARALAAQDDDALAQEVARHLERAGDGAAAAEAYARAAAFASTQGAARQVVSAAGRALSLGVGAERHYALHVALAEALEALGRLDEQGPHLDAALRLATGDAERARVLTDRAVWLQRGGHAEEAIEAATLAEEAARAAQDLLALALALGRRAFARIYAGQLDDAALDLADAERLAEAVAPELRPFAAAWRAQLAGARGDHGARREAYAQAVALYEEAGDLRRAAGAELNLADVLNRVGGFAEAEAALRDVVAKCERIGSQVWEGYARTNLAYALTRLDRPDDALAQLDAVEVLAARTREVRLQRVARVYRARALGLRDPVAGAAEAEAVAAEPEVAQALEVLAHTVASRLHLRSGDAARALRCSERAFAILEELGGIEEDEAEVYLAHAEALAAHGRPEEAAKVRALGRRRIEEVAARIADPEWRRRVLEDVPAHRALLRR
ncbi:MAG TPA: protein kinase [Sandaracinaceae bacterium LLY-WYZ-13_1]|nr:protein kinase [Sandaracinaceae bacterium LLY-WYZ-13_1]